MVNCSIITIGDELLIGQVIDTNSAWMAQQLNKIGIPVTRRVAVGDNVDAIWKALDEESLHAEIILLTGGLGPTADDITKPLLCKYFGGTMIMNKDVLDHVTNLFEMIFKRPLSEVNRKQAEVPDCCTVIPNQRGSAPGMLFEKAGKIFISLPGVPHEMKGIMDTGVLPMLAKKYNLAPIQHRTLLTAGIGESMLAAMIKDFEENLPSHISLAYLPNFGMVRLRLSAAVSNDTVGNEIDELFTRLQFEVKEFLVTNVDEPMQEVVGKLLIERKKTIATAESCTGGFISHLLTTIPGSSSFYNGSIISYSNKTKQDLLEVNEMTLEKMGAVSEDVVKEMLTGILKKIPSDYAIAVSGIMGPGGGSEEKPVGTVWIAVGNNSRIETQKVHFRFERNRNIELTAIHALNMLRKFVLETIRKE
ncbi:MAG: CinA family nicotinamide mononucleotide deamidase-related protein [Ferruginibacter sp.]